MKRVAILHYASPPVVGGVELTIAHHARSLADLGYQVTIISGRGGTFDPRIPTQVHPLLSSSASEVLLVKRELDEGRRTPSFDRLVAQLVDILGELLSGCDVLIAHNIHTLNKNLPLTAALRRLNLPRVIAWCHDLAWTNEQYLPELHPGYPWELLRQAWPNTRYVTVSEPRRRELAQLLGLPEDAVEAVTGGVDVPGFLQWTTQMRYIEEQLGLLSADVLLLLPARLTRRKNIGLALHVLAALRRQTGQDCRLIVSGPPGPHNPTNPGYLGELLSLRQKLGLQRSAHFLYELEDPPLIPDDTTMANLYQIADAMLFPSLQEGFGLPILEAGLIGLPIFCSDLPPFRQTGQDDVHFFDPVQDSPESIAQKIAQELVNQARQRLKARVRQRYRWDALIQTHLVPMLEAL
ncbi:MAG: glycosyltransferase family 4 protein [Anaerolineae bacterium]|nr:glycosyltransferase family 4 protein [Anaerolineae bacterium]MDW8171715.1 glycosyltransferase family 4 protein [Anaerolineae bacterium]